MEAKERMAERAVWAVAGARVRPVLDVKRVARRRERAAVEVASMVYYYLYVVEFIVLLCSFVVVRDDSCYTVNFIITIYCYWLMMCGNDEKQNNTPKIQLEENQ
mmetsp:Transcript_836/g.1708  ORF Transcript_836/g.1708 Transcript_836/m.1708 type:complete len:104 (-) Transcript_836:77-388(-)